MIALHLATDFFAFSEEQKDFNAFNKLRGSFHHYPVAAGNYNNEKVFNANGWTKNDYLSFDAWFFMDERKFNTEKIANIFYYRASERQSATILTNEIKNNIKTYYINYLLVAVLGVILFVGLGYYHGLILLGYIIYCFAGIAALQIYFRFPSHIAPQVFMIIYLISLFIAYLYELKISNRNLSIMIIALLLPVLLLKTEDMSKKIFDSKHLYDFFNRAYTLQLHKKYAGKTFIMPIMPQLAIPMEYSSTPLQENQIPINIIPFGWLIYSPLFYKSIKKYLNVQYAFEIFPAAANNDNVYLISAEYWVPVVQRYLSETFENKYQIILVEKTGICIDNNYISVFAVKERHHK
jgi:hypothetical protein